ncbi:uncharacterized protein [Typha latifolia]|uniref:uncharacterized protein n=1 Tax=Typha latifolia TaxID=4733 RepID=UPI003C2FB962
MGSLEEEERLVQMVHHFMESDTPSTPNTILPSSQAIPLYHLTGILESSTEAEMEVLEKVSKYVKKMGKERQRSSVQKRLMMRLIKDGYDASLCISSWVATMEYPGGDYEYIDIALAEESGILTRLIVDIEFRSQFEVARPTKAYTQLSSILPPIFVGREEKLKKVVSLLCSAAQQSLKERGLHIPPWRRSSYMQSKWLSSCHKACIPGSYSKGVSQKSSTGGSHSHTKDRRGEGPKEGRHEGAGLSSQFSEFSINCC